MTLKYLGIMASSYAKQYKNRADIYYHHTKIVKGKEVKYYEVVLRDENVVVVNKNNIKAFHKHFSRVK